LELHLHKVLRPPPNDRVLTRPMTLQPHLKFIDSQISERHEDVDFDGFIRVYCEIHLCILHAYC
jgi:hypothetical protein